MHACVHHQISEESSCNHLWLFDTSVLATIFLPDGAPPLVKKLVNKDLSKLRIRSGEYLAD